MKRWKKRWMELLSVMQNRSMKFWISVSFTLISAFGMGFIGIFFYRSYGNTAEEIVINDRKQVLDQVEINLSSYLRNMMRISDAMYFGVIKNLDLDEEGMNQQMNLLYESNKDNLVSISCFTKDGELVGSAPVGNLKRNTDVTKQSWFISAEDKMENIHFSDLHVQNVFENKSNRYYWVVSLSRGVELTKRGKMEAGILLVDMDFSGIRQLFTKVNTQDMGYIYLIDSEGKIIYHPKQNLLFFDMMKENNLKAANYEDGTHREMFENEARMVEVKTVGYTGWKIVSVTPMERFYSDFSRTKTMAVVICILAILTMILANQFIAIRVVLPLKKLEDSLEGIGVNQEPQIYIGGSPEVQHLGETIRSMVLQLRKLTDDIVKEQEKKRKSELDALQSQINPHFLYNTLDSIMWMVEAEQYEDAISMVQSLGKLFRISLSKGKNIISIGEELQHARSYLEIQKYRYKNKFSSYFEIEEGIEQYKTIKLIIQPLIENAIYYGMEYMDGEGEIYIRVYSKEEDLVIEVEDNGPGMTEEQVKNLLRNESRVRSKGSGIGVKNVHQRVQLYFGKKYGLHIFSEPDVGTRIQIWLPKTMEVEEERKEEIS